MRVKRGHYSSGKLISVVTTREFDKQHCDFVDGSGYMFGEDGTNSTCPRHWPIGLIYDNHTISTSVRASSTASSSTGAGVAPDLEINPLKLILHLASPPTEKLLLPPSAEACKQAFMGQLKEADFIRWGNTKRVTGLRKAEQDGMWEGIRERE